MDAAGLAKVRLAPEVCRDFRSVMYSGVFLLMLISGQTNAQSEAIDAQLKDETSGPYEVNAPH